MASTDRQSSPQIALGRRVIDQQARPYLIAEIGVHHEGRLDLALRLIDLCREGGADAAKFQTYKASRIASRYSPAYWDTTKETTTSQFELFSKYDAFGPREYEALARHCADVGIDFVSTPFDTDAVDVLDPLMTYFKVASADVTNVPLLRKVGSKKKPVILSSGASTLEEVDTAIDILTRSGSPVIAVMHCVLNYPTLREGAHLGMIVGLQRHYPDRVIGYSDHVAPDASMTVLTTAHLLGAAILEKHFTHDKALPGNDHYHAMDIVDLKELNARLDDIQLLKGHSQAKSPVTGEEAARLNARRSIVIVRAMAAGEVITERDLDSKRPGTGLSPLDWDNVIGRRTARSLEADAVLQWEDLE